MAYLTIARVAGDPDELLARYRETSSTMTDVGRDHGLMVHAVAQTPHGLMMVNLWPDSCGSEAAARDRRRVEVMRRHGLAPEDVEREHHEVPDYVLFGWPRRLRSGVTAPRSRSARSC